MLCCLSVLGGGGASGRSGRMHAQLRALLHPCCHMRCTALPNPPAAPLRAAPRRPLPLGCGAGYGWQAGWLFQDLWQIVFVQQSLVGMYFAFACLVGALASFVVTMGRLNGTAEVRGGRGAGGWGMGAEDGGWRGGGGGLGAEDGEGVVLGAAALGGGGRWGWPLGAGRYGRRNGH